jgi:hypothetical protein
LYSLALFGAPLALVVAKEELSVEELHRNHGEDELLCAENNQQIVILSS